MFAANAHSWCGFALSLSFVLCVSRCVKAQSHLAPWRCSLCLLDFVVALPPDVLVAMNDGVAGVV